MNLKRHVLLYWFSLSNSSTFGSGNLALHRRSMKIGSSRMPAVALPSSAPDMDAEAKKAFDAERNKRRNEHYQRIVSEEVAARAAKTAEENAARRRSEITKGRTVSYTKNALEKGR